MARMGNYNLQLQEIANELGFSTTQEALDNGYHVVEDMMTGEATLKKLDEEELAHEAWLKEKKVVLEGLNSCLETSECSPACDIDIERAIKFIEGVSHE